MLSAALVPVQLLIEAEANMDFHILLRQCFVQDTSTVTCNMWPEETVSLIPC